MAGQDQSQNLGGMLSEIGKTVGSMGSSLNPLLQAATKPRGDMNDPAHLSNLAQWASANGDTAAASMYMTQARDAKAEGRVEEERLRKETKAKAAGAATMQYKTALESGVAGDIEKAESALIANAAALGYDPLDRLNAAHDNVRRAKDEAYAEGERTRVAQERAFTESFSGKMNSTTDADAIQDAVNQAPAEMQPAAQRAATARLQFLEGVSAREARESENLQIVDASITIPTSLPATLQTQYKAEVAQLEKDIEAGKNADGKTWEPSVRRALQNRRDRLAEKIGDTLVRDVLRQEEEARAEARAWEKEYQDASGAIPTKDQAKEIRKDLESADAGEGPEGFAIFGEGTKRVTEEQVIEYHRNGLRTALEPFRPGGVKAEAVSVASTEDNQKKWPKAPEIGTVKNGMRYKGGNPAVETSWEDAKSNE